jgi:hypothetical protein
VYASYASQYRLRLVAAQLVQPAGHGGVDFAPPYLRVSLGTHPRRREVSRRERLAKGPLPQLRRRLRNRAGPLP